MNDIQVEHNLHELIDCLKSYDKEIDELVQHKIKAILDWFDKSVVSGDIFYLDGTLKMVFEGRCQDKLEFKDKYGSYRYYHPLDIQDRLFMKVV